ncbi:MAG: hypothetical protein CSA81_03670 [Acidobacteria bacterium]|nr:MAG: hypothetical protein CSA81_03670 [Acidobacteriota bacterium]
MDYSKVLCAKNEEGKMKFAEDGELLIAASPGAKCKVKLRKTDHFFVGLQSGKPSLYGWVKDVKDPISVEELIEKVKLSPGLVHIGRDIKDIKKQIHFTMNGIIKLKEGTPVLTDFSDKSFKDKTQVQKIHKVFLK